MSRDRAPAKRLSLPREHGAHLMLVGAVLAATLTAVRPLPALAMALVLVAAFLARGPLERRASGHALRSWDGWAIVVLGILTLVGALGVALEVTAAWALVGIVAGLAASAAAFLVRRAHWHRSIGVEVVAMGALGASAGLMAVCGDAAPRAAAALGLVLGAHAVTSVIVLHTRLRPRARAGRRVALLEATGLVIAVAAALVALGLPGMTLALAPRAAQIGLAFARKSDVPRRAPTLGLAETGLLALTVVAVLVVRH